MLQKFFAAIYEEKAEWGYFVTTAQFASTAYEYASENRIKLIDGIELAKLMKQAYPENNSTNFNVICLDCSDKVSFSIYTDQGKTKLCKNGHPVKSNITWNDINRII